MCPIYIINLLESSERWDNVCKQLNALELEYYRFDAYDGYSLSDVQIKRHFDHIQSRRGLYHLTLPEIACYLSHLSLWHLIISDDLPGMFIMEDDFIASNDLPMIIDAISTQYTNKEIIIKLFPSEWPNHTIIKSKRLDESHNIVFPYHIPWGCVAYYINNAAARILIAKRNTFFRPVDDDMRYFWETGINVGVVSPAPIMLNQQYHNTSILAQLRYFRRRDQRKNIIKIIKLLRRRIQYESLNCVNIFSRL